MNKIESLWHHLIGSEDVYKLERRIFHGVILLSVAIQFAIVPFNFALGLIYPAFVWLGVLVLGAVMFYLARFKNSYRTAFALYGAAGYVALTVNYMVNDGIDGPSLMLFLTFFLMLVSMSPLRWIVVWFIAQVAVMTTLVLLEYNHPGFVLEHYPSEDVRIGDHLFSTLSMMLVVVCLVYILRKAYKKQTRKVAALASKVKEQNLRLEKVNLQKDKLMSITSHDMRGPLLSIKGYYELLNDGETQLNEAQMAGLTNHLISMVNNTIGMLDNVVAWSKGQLGAYEAPEHPVTVDEAIHEVLEVYQLMAKDKQVVIVTKCDPGLCVYYNGGALRTVLRNVISNAIKFSHVNSTIHVICAEQGDNCSVKVTDTGVGMSPSKLQSLFSVGSGTTYGTSGERGTGLGLALCKEMLEAGGATIAVESTEGKGTEVCIHLPVKQRKIEAGQ